MLGVGASASQGACGQVWRQLGYTARWGVLLASKGERPGMLLHILQCTGQPPVRGKGLPGPRCQ